MINYLNTFYYLAIMSIGLYLLIQGWRIIFQGKKLLLPTERVGFWLIRIFQGEKTYNHRLDQYFSSNEIKVSGFSALLAGLFAIILSVINVYVIISKSFIY